MIGELYSNVSTHCGNKVKVNFISSPKHILLVDRDVKMILVQSILVLIPYIQLKGSVLPNYCVGR